MENIDKYVMQNKIDIDMHINYMNIDELLEKVASYNEMMPCITLCSVALQCSVNLFNMTDA